MNMKVNLAGVEFKNPVMEGSGTFGSLSLIHILKGISTTTVLFSEAVKCLEQMV